MKRLAKEAMESPTKAVVLGSKVCDLVHNQCRTINLYLQRDLPDFIAQFKATFNNRVSEMVIVFAHAHLYQEAPRHALVVKKRPSSLHAGMYNLPGGKLNGIPDSGTKKDTIEEPAAAALRKLKEETNCEGTFPQLLGVIAPVEWISPDDAPYLVYIYRVILAPNQTCQGTEDQPASWQPIQDANNGKWVPNAPLILSLCASGMRDFVIQDTHWPVAMELDNHNNSPNGDPKDDSQSNLSTGNWKGGISQQIVTFLQPARDPRSRNERFST